MQPRHVARVFDVVQAAEYPEHVWPGLRGTRQSLKDGFVGDEVVGKLAFVVDESAAALEHEPDLRRVTVT